MSSTSPVTYSLELRGFLFGLGDVRSVQDQHFRWFAVRLGPAARQLEPVPVRGGVESLNQRVAIEAAHHPHVLESGEPAS